MTTRCSWSSLQVFEGPPLGLGIESASLNEVLEAIEAAPAGLDWPALADQVVPVFQRVRPYPPGLPAPLRIVVPPGLSVGFAIEIGPAFLHVNAEMVERWRLTPAEVLGRALDNLDRRMAGVAPDDVHDGSIPDQPIRMLQSPTGCASAYVLLPTSLRRILGSEPQLLIAPMRNLLISLPIEADREFAAWLFDEVAGEDPNHLAPAAFLSRGDGISVEPLGQAFGRAWH